MDHNTNTNDASVWSLILTFLAGIFTVIEQSSADDIYKWIFRILTLVSLILMIIINWKKAYAIVFKPEQEIDNEKKA